MEPTHCQFCGARYADGPWPRTCAACGKTSYRNPLPVAVLVVPVDDGILVMRRAVAPRIGELALPGGFIGVGESWQAAGARELLEETGITVDPAGVRELTTRSAPDGTVLIFGVSQPLKAKDLPPFVPSDECSERLVITAPTKLAFPIHTDVATAFLEGSLKAR
jgi:ADP-ribose pyrophosphatase YjhB (NUDIX family)